MTKKDLSELPFDNVLHTAWVLLIRAEANKEEILLYPSWTRFWYTTEKISFCASAFVVFLWADRQP